MEKYSNKITELKSKADSEPIASFLNMRLLELSEGYAKVSMKIIPQYTNFNGFTFGGIIMSLADEAFAYATNTGDNPNVAVQFNISFLSPANTNDELTAECHVIKQGKRASISEITVINNRGKLIAKAVGTTIPYIKHKVRA